jgi:hypothetical protein
VPFHCNEKVLYLLLQHILYYEVTAVLLCQAILIGPLKVSHILYHSNIEIKILFATVISVVHM